MATTCIDGECLWTHTNEFMTYYTEVDYVGHFKALNRGGVSCRLCRTARCVTISSYKSDVSLVMRLPACAGSYLSWGNLRDVEGRFWIRIAHRVPVSYLRYVEEIERAVLISEDPAEFAKLFQGLEHQGYRSYVGGCGDGTWKRDEQLCRSLLCIRRMPYGPAVRIARVACSLEMRGFPNWDAGAECRAVKALNSVIKSDDEENTERFEPFFKYLRSRPDYISACK